MLLRFFEVASVFVRLNHVARVIVNANYSIMRTAAMRSVADCVRNCGWLAVPQLTESEPIGD